MAVLTCDSIHVYLAHIRYPRSTTPSAVGIGTVWAWTHLGAVKAVLVDLPMGAAAAVVDLEVVVVAVAGEAGRPRARQGSGRQLRWRRGYSSAQRTNAR